MITDNLTDEQRALRAKKAVEAFRRMQPMLNSYARAFTGNKRISVEISATIKAATDGKKIYFCPPIGLGDDLKHTKSLCDRRDPETLLQMCKACEVKEGILVIIYHEIAHVCYGTFNAPSETESAELVEKVLAETPGRYAERARKMVSQAPAYVTDNFMGMATLINPYLKIILNAVEDARVNANLFNARRGTKTMFDAQSKLIFERGIEMIDPKTGEVSYAKWNERELNMQVIIGLFCAAVDYEYDDWFAPEVVAALKDDEIQGLLAQVRGSKAVGDSYALSFLLLKRLRELGFCQNPDDPEDEQPEEKDQESGDDGKPSDQSDESEGDTSDPQDEQSDDEGEGSGDGQSSEADGDEGESDDEGEQGSGSSETEADDAGEESDGSPSDVAGDQDGESGDDPGADDEGLGNSGDQPDVDEPAEGGDIDEAADEPGQPGASADADGNDGDDTGSASEPTDSDDFDSGESNSVRDDGVDETASPTTDEYFGDDTEPAPLEDNPDDEEIDQGGMVPEDAVDLTDESSTPKNYGTPEEAERGLEQFGGHDHDEDPPTPEDLANQAALERAIMQGMYFETGSENITGVREHRYGTPVLNRRGQDVSTAWTGRHYSHLYTPSQMGMRGDYRPAESTLGKPLLKLRTVFESNARSHNQAHLKSGRVNGRVLGKRAPLGDERLFRKKIIPGKRDYFVVIGLDISGSTIGQNLGLIKAAAWAQAELLTRLGIPFAVYAFTAAFEDPSNLSMSQDEMYLDMYLIKEANEPWNVKTQERLQRIGPDGGNLDGHNMEFFRKVCDKSTATDKIIMYYSDGRMPASNFDEELEILERELKICKQKGYTVCGVGIRTDSPKEHGLPTVQVDSKEDVMKVVTFLEQQLRAK